MKLHYKCTILCYNMWYFHLFPKQPSSCATWKHCSNPIHYIMICEIGYTVEVWVGKLCHLLQYWWHSAMKSCFIWLYYSKCEEIPWIIHGLPQRREFFSGRRQSKFATISIVSIHLLWCIDYMYMFIPRTQIKLGSKSYFLPDLRFP